MVSDAHHAAVASFAHSHFSPSKHGGLVRFRSRIGGLAALSPKPATTMNNRLITDLPGITPEIWTVYESTIQELGKNIRGLRKNAPKDVEPVTSYLLYDRCFLDVTDLNGFSGSETKEKLNKQKELFIRQSGFSSSQYEFCLRCLTYLGDFCAQKRTPQPLMVGWYKMNECGMIARENGISTYMYGLSLDEALNDVTAEIASYHDLLYEPNEKTVTLRIKALIARNDAVGAEKVLASLPDKGESDDWKRLRTYFPILSYYCVQNDFTSVLRVFRQMRNSPGAHMDADTYALILGTLARNGCFREDCTQIEGALEAGFSSACGVKLFDEMATEMASDIMELTEASALVLQQSISQGFARAGVGAETHCRQPSDQGDVFADRVAIDKTTGLCPQTGAKLRLFVLDSMQRKHVHDTLLMMADMQHKEMMERAGKLVASNDHDYAMRELSKFSQWLEQRDGAPFTALVDGANVAYFGHADVHYSQIDLVVKELLRMGENPLVIMPEKYTMAKFRISSGFVQKLTYRDLVVLERLRSTRRMYVVPSKCFDDYYWMLGSVSNQSNSCNGTDMYITPGSECVRFPGLRPMLVTNDLMRDHRLALLEPRLFRRWSSSHIVSYNISSYENGEWNERLVQFFPADCFSREIQSNAAAGGQVWHFPVAEWGDYDRMCIHFPGRRVTCDAS